jgi:hypothetical protein
MVIVLLLNKHSGFATMSIQVVFEELRKIYEDYDEGQRLSVADVQRWSALLGVSVDVLCDQLSACLVRGFHKRVLSFEF